MNSQSNKDKDSLGNKNGWCSTCTYAALCLPVGHDKFVHGFKPETTVGGIGFDDPGEIAEMAESVFGRVGQMVCMLGNARLTAPVFDVPKPESTRELRCYIQGYTRGVCEVVRDIQNQLYEDEEDGKET